MQKVIDFLRWKIHKIKQNLVAKVTQLKKITRKSSCVNARDIPTAAYRALHLLSCTGGGAVPLPGGYPCQGGTPPWVSTPPSDLTGGTPSLLGGTPPWVPPPQSDFAREYPTLGTPPSSQSWLGPPSDMSMVPPIWT